MLENKRVSRYLAIPAVLLFSLLTAVVPAFAYEARYVNPETGYEAYIIDDEELLTDAQEEELLGAYMKPITEYDLEGVPPTFHPIGSLSNVMREDVEVQSFTQKMALSNAPAQQDGCFLIPSILGEGGDR